MRLPDIEKRTGNLCKYIKDLGKIGEDVVRLAKLDDRSRKEWLDRSKHGMDLALQVVEEKTTPWPGASNVKYPLITSAALQFHARAYSGIVQGDKVVKGKVTGFDSDGLKAEKALRTSQHMNWQLLEENEDWEVDFDRLLLALSIEGCEFKKSYFSKEKGHNESEWIRPENLIVHNGTKSLEKAPRITQRLFFYPYEIDIKVRSGMWRSVDLDISEQEQEDEKSQEFYEQHKYLDLDNDGFKEPYIITVHVRSQQVVRVVSGFFVKDIKRDGKKIVSIPRAQLFTKYEFIPSPNGSFYGIGFGWLIGPLSDAVDTNINQLIDAGTLSTNAAGFVADGVKVGSSGRGEVKFEKGEFKRIKIPSSKSLNESIFQFRFNEPSMVLFQLLGMLVQAAKDVTSVQAILTGAEPQNEEKATTSMIRVEQGMKVFSSIYKRIYRSLKQEFKKLYKLNAIFLQPEQYFTVLDTQQGEIAYQSDYQDDGTDVQPVADPQLATSTLALAKNQQIMGTINHPLSNDEEILKRFYEGLEVPNPELLIIPKDQRQQPPNPELVLKAQVEASKHAERKMKMLRDYADAMKKFAEAEGTEQGRQWQQYMDMIKIAMEEMNGTGRNQGQPGRVHQVPSSGTDQMSNGSVGIPGPI